MSIKSESLTAHHAKVVYMGDENVTALTAEAPILVNTRNDDALAKNAR